MILHVGGRHLPMAAARAVESAREEAAVGD
jgi:hypothetical protein